MHSFPYVVCSWGWVGQLRTSNILKEKPVYRQGADKGVRKAMLWTGLSRPVLQLVEQLPAPLISDTVATLISTWSRSRETKRQIRAIFCHHIFSTIWYELGVSVDWTLNLQIINSPNMPLSILSCVITCVVSQPGVQTTFLIRIMNAVGESSWTRSSAGTKQPCMSISESFTSAYFQIRTKSAVWLAALWCSSWKKLLPGKIFKISRKRHNFRKKQNVIPSTVAGT